MPEAPGHDTELARLLHGEGRVDLTTLQGCLQQARAQRGQGATLASLLVGQGLLRADEADGYLSRLGGGSPADPRGRSGELASSQASWAAGPADPRGRSGELASSQASWAAGPADPRGRSGELASSHASFAPGSRRPSGRVSSGSHSSLAAWQPGTWVGPYRIVEKLGAGTMGQVFLAEHADHGTRYAIKTLSLRAGEERIGRMRREGEAQARADGHINVVRVHDMSEALGRLYLVMELADGGDLDDRLRRGPLEPLEAARVAAALARGLGHMHDAGVLHRDLKPGNVVFDAHGTPKLTDFGLARFEGAHDLTRTGDLIGTPVYMAPEQAMGYREQIGERSDVYGLGALLYHCLTGEVPFGGKSTVEVIAKLSTEAPRRPTALRAEVPPELEAICLRCLEKDPAERPDAEGLADALEAFLTGAGTDEREVPARPRWGLLLAAGLGCVLLAASALAVSLGWVDPVEPAPAAADTPTAAGKPGGTGPPPVPPAASTSEAAREPAEPVVAWAWGADQRLRYRVEHRFLLAVNGNDVIESVRTFLLVCDPAAVGDGLATVECTLAGMGVHWYLDGRMMGRGERRVDYDSFEGGETSPFDRVIGRTFSFELELLTGRVLRVEGVEQLQREIFGDMSERERWTYYVPELAEAAEMRNCLEAFFRLAAAAPSDGTVQAPPPWTIERSSPFVPRIALGSVLARAVPAVEATFTPDPRAPGVSWRGSGSGSAEGGRMFGALDVERDLRGFARLSGGVVASADYQEEWSGSTRLQEWLAQRMGMQPDLRFEVTATGEATLLEGLAGGEADAAEPR